MLHNTDCDGYSEMIVMLSLLTGAEQLERENVPPTDGFRELEKGGYKYSTGNDIPKQELRTRAFFCQLSLTACQACHHAHHLCILMRPRGSSSRIQL